eukprot:TRINITY_DN132_c2_g1_i3.p1 TRINITY_DN132_c2_g1~~TRINITY_DN132_c2_g1_i3.p1  ORF type:complete len:122 (+),score=51.45 TRINITY_DN132_c2_g1_i3:292-657(+)
MSNSIPFKEENNFEKRASLSRKILETHPDRVPVIVEKQTANDPDIARKKFLVPQDLTWLKCTSEIRKHITLGKGDALQFLIGRSTPPTAETMQLIYDRHKDEDGFLYVTYAVQPVSGSISF